MVLVERSRELSSLLSTFRTSRQGLGRVVSVEGPTASGKTALLSRFAVEANASGALVLTMSGSREEQDTAGAALSRLALQLSGPVRPTPGPADPLTPAAPADDASRRLSDAVTQALIRVSGTQALVLLADDCDLFDKVSLHALLNLCRSIVQLPVMVVVTQSDTAGQGNTVLHADFSRVLSARTLRLAYLSVEGVASILRLDGGAPPTDAGVSMFHRVTGGNPMLVRALVEDRHETVDVPASDRAVAENFRRAVVVCLRRCEATVQQVARAIAVLGEPATPALTTATVGVTDQASVDHSLAVLDHIGLLDGCRFRHPEAALAILDDLTAADRCAAHSKAAGALYAEGLPPETVAAHLVAAGSVPDRWASGPLQAAAEQSVHDNRLPDAVAYLSLAHRASATEPPTAESVSLLASLARVEWLVNPARVVKYLPALRDAMRRSMLTERECADFLTYQLWHDPGRDASEVMRSLGIVEAGRPAHREHDTTFCDSIRLLVTLPKPLDGLPGLDTSRLQQPGPTTSTRSSEHEWRAVAAEEFLGTCTLLTATPEAVIAAINSFRRADRLDRAAHWCAELGREAHVRGATTWRAILADLGGQIALRQGDFDAARRHARLALDLIPPHRWGAKVGSPMGVLLLVLAASGEVEEGQALLGTALSAPARRTWHWAQYLRGRGHLHLAAGHFYAAQADFLATRDIAMKTKLDVPSLIPWRSDLARVHLQVGNLDPAARLINQQLDKPALVDTRCRGISLFLLSKSVVPEHRRPLLYSSVKLLEKCGDRFHHQLALADLATTIGTVTDQRPVRIPPQERRAVTESGTHDRQHELTGAEARVASLAASGYSNPAIGEELYITVSTVEQHLTRVYRKLGIRGRADLRRQKI